MEMTFSEFLMCQNLSSILLYHQEQRLGGAISFGRAGAPEVMTVHNKTVGPRANHKSKAIPLLQSESGDSQ